MKLVSNSIQPNDVREETRNGNQYLVIESVPFIKSMELAGGYVPEAEIRANTPNWKNTPLTVNHPTNDPNKPWYVDNHPVYDKGDFLPVDFHPQIQEQLVIGNAENPEYDGTYTRVDMAVNADKAKRLGGHAADIVRKIENNKPFNVSSQYAPKDLGPGIYDGKQVANAEGIDKTDSIALLPHKPGQCSLSDGCGINPDGVTANLRVPMTDDAGSSVEDMGTHIAMQGNNVSYAVANVSPDDFSNDDYVDSEWNGSQVMDDAPNPSESEDAKSYLDAICMVHPTGDEARDDKSNWKLPFRSSPDSGPNTRALVAIDSALSGARGGVEGLGQDTKETVSNKVQSLLDDAPDSLFGAEEQSGNSLVDRFIGWVVSGEQTANEEAEPSAEENTTMSQKTAELVANHGFKEDNLPPEETECFSRIYDAVTSNESEPEEEEQTANEDYVTEDQLESFKDDLVESLSEEMSANQEQSEKQDLATEIVANSAEYDDEEAVLEDYPTKASLEAKKDSLNMGSAVPGAGAGLSANRDSDELEDVSAGVFE